MDIDADDTPAEVQDPEEDIPDIDDIPSKTYDKLLTA
jgi:hypothetical protein